MRLVYIPEALRMLRRRMRVAVLGVKKYDGDSKRICSSIIQDCFDRKKKYFRTSSGHFCEFYCRDFGWSSESLVKLGYKDEVVDTLSYALSAFEKSGRIRQTISPSGIAFTFPEAYSPDALAFIIRSLKDAGDRQLVKEHCEFLSSEVFRHFSVAVDKKSGLIRKNMHFSSMKDYAIRQSSCYDNAINGMMKSDLSSLGLPNPLRRFNYARLLVKHFWAGNYFRDDLSGNQYVCGDANVVPFWAGVVKSRPLLKKAIRAVRSEGLDQPFPLKYTARHVAGQSMIQYERLAGNYERDSVWAHMGLMFIRNVSTVDRELAWKYLLSYEQNILMHKNFLEVYDQAGRPFKTPFYYSDEGMLWAANYLSILEDLE